MSFLLSILGGKMLKESKAYSQLLSHSDVVRDTQYEYPEEVIDCCKKMMSHFSDLLEEDYPEHGESVHELFITLGVATSVLTATDTSIVDTPISAYLNIRDPIKPSWTGLKTSSDVALTPPRLLNSRFTKSMCKVKLRTAKKVTPNDPFIFI